MAQYQVENSTPVFDSIVDYLLEHQVSRRAALVAALVFGVIWRYNQMIHGVCYARQDRLANDIQICTRTLQRHLALLIDRGLIIDEHPGRRTKTHNYRISPLGYDLITPPAASSADKAAAPPLYDSLTHHGSSSCSNDSEEKIDHEDYQLYCSDFGEMTTAQKSIFKKWGAELPREWLEAAVLQTIGSQPDSPFNYLKRVVEEFKAAGGPAAPEPRPAEPAPAAAEGRKAPARKTPDLPYFSEVKSETGARLPTAPRTAAQRQALARICEQVIQAAVDDGRLSTWKNELAWDDPCIIGTLANMAHTDYLGQGQMGSAYGEREARFVR